MKKHGREVCTIGRLNMPWKEISWKEYCEKMKNICLGINKWLVTKKQTVDKKTNEKEENIEKYINRKFFFASR